MGTYVNPGNLAFQRIAGSNYVDKTDLIRLMNARVDSSDCLVCVSRPRRFGKSYAVKMLTAYYDRSCNSHRLFDDKKIAKSENYEKFLNQYNVICLDISGFISEAKATLRPLVEVPQMIMRALRDPLLLVLQTSSPERPAPGCLCASSLFSPFRQPDCLPGTAPDQP